MSIAEAFELRLSGGHRLAGLAWGEVSARLPVVALHGWQDNAASFTTLAPALGRRVEAIDLPGHGRSSWRPGGATHHFSGWVVDVQRALDALGHDQVVLIGHSMGAAIAALSAAAMPERVARLVMLEGLGPITTPPEDAPSQLRRALAFPLPTRPRRVYKTLDELVARRCAVDPSLSASGARALVSRGAMAVEGGVSAGEDPRLRTPSLMRLTEPQVRALLGSIECPAFVMRARQGWPVSEEMMARRLACLSNVEQAEVEGGHHVHLDAPERFLDALLRFLG